jgi:ubiquitin conjugation factor E4 B
VASQPFNKRPNVAVNETVDQYSDRLLTQIFRVTVDPQQTIDSNGHRLQFLEGTSQELADEGVPLQLTKERLDSALMEASSLQSHDAPLLSYLLPCFKRAHKALTLSKEGPGEKREVLQEAKRLAVSHCLFALTLPDLFGRPEADDVVPFLLRSVEHEDSLPPEFVKEAIDRFDEDEQYPAIFANAMATMSKSLALLTMGREYRPYVNAMIFYTRFPALLKAVAQHPDFLAGTTGPEVEMNSILGPFFRLSPLQHEILQTYFPNPRQLDQGRVHQAQQTLQTVLRVHQDELFGITNAFIRADTDIRSRVLDWFALGVNTNHKRRALRSNPEEVSTDGFMINLTVVLDRFCDPFLDSTFSKVDKIDADYFRRKPRVNVRDETKINADQAVSDSYYDQTDPKSSNFISEIFFLTLAAHHYGSGAATAKLKQLERDIKHYEKHIGAMEAERPKVQNVSCRPFTFSPSLP